MSQDSSPPSRQQLRLQSITWALGAGLTALVLGTPLGLGPALRAGGCGFFYGLLAFHLQRVDPDDGHLQAAGPWPEGLSWPAAAVAVAPTVMMGLIRAWLPLVGAALLLHFTRQLLSRGALSARRP